MSSERGTLVDGPDRPWWLTEHTLAELGIDSLQVVRILEWFAWKIWIAGEEGSGDPDYYGKSYDPLAVELSSDGSGVAHSYVFDLHDGGRHHDFDSLTDLEQKLTAQLVGTVAWAISRGAADALEGLAEHFWLEDHPGDEATWRSYEKLNHEARNPYYDRAKSVVERGKAAA